VTGCALISPTEVNFPILLGDTVVTVEGRPSSHRIAPTRIREPFEHADFQQVYLARKTYILNDNTAIAVAGEEGPIAEFLDAAALVLEDPTWAHRPMRALAQHVKGFSGVEVIGAYVRPSQPRFLNFLHPLRQGPKLFPRLGQVFAVGTGAPEIIALLQRYEDGTTHPEDNPSRAFNAARFVQHCRAGEEIFLKDWDPSWGGFIERLHFDYDLGRWVRQPKTLHLYFQANLEHGKLSDFQLIDRFFAYDPGGDIGQVLCALGRPAGVTLVSHVLANLLLPPAAHIPSKNHWSDWRPDEVIVTAVVAGTKHVVMGSFDPRKETDETYLKVGSERFQFSFPWTAVSKVFDGLRKRLAQKDR
jgi:hypothetical protein